MFSAGRRRLTQLKPDVVQLINEHYLPLGRQIAICLPALVPSVLLLIEENDEKIRNMSIACVDAIVGICGSRMVNGCIFMGLLRNPSYRMALLKYVNLSKKEKKLNVPKELSVIESQGALEDLQSEFIKVTDEDFSENHNPRSHTIRSLLDRPLIADKLERDMTAEKDKDHMRFNSVYDTRRENTPMVNFGDDQAINYSEEVIKLKKEDKYDFSKNEKNIVVPVSGVSGDVTPMETPGKVVPFSVEDETAKTPQQIPTAQLTAGQNLLSNRNTALETQSEKIIPTPTKPKDLSEPKSATLPTPPPSSKQDTATKQEDDDPYGLGTSGSKNLIYDQKELEKYREKLMLEFAVEFKEALTTAENLPRGVILLSSIKACLNDENKLVKRGILDMVNNHIKLISTLLLSEEQKVELVEAMLHLLLRRDLSVTRRIYLWFFGEPDNDNIYVLDESKRFVLDYIELAFERIFNTFEFDDVKNCSAPLKILQNFYMDHERAVDQTIGRIALPIIRYIYLKGIKNKDEKVAEEIQKSGLRFLSCISSHFHLVVEQISKAIPDASDAELISYCGIIRFIKDCFSNPELQIAQLKVEVKLLEGLTAFILRIKITDLIDSYINNDYDRIKLTLKVLEIFVEILAYIYKEQNHQWTREDLKSMIMSIPSINSALENFEKDFIDLSKVLSTFKMEENYITFKDATGEEQVLYEELPPILIKALRQSILSVVIMQKVVYTTKTVNLMTFPSWMVALVNCIKSNEPSICRIAIEGLIFAISSDRREPIFLKLREIIKAQAAQRPNYEGATPSVAGSNSSPFQRESYSSVAEVVIDKLWQLMDFQPFHDEAVRMLREINILVPELISNYSNAIITSSNYTEKEKSFKRFSAFWKNTMDKTGEIDPYLAQINKLGLFMMIEFLDDENPLLRHASKNWLVDSIGFLDKIIDPLVEDMICNTTFYCSEGGQFFFTEKYDTAKVFGRFKKLKNILLTITDLFTDFLVKQVLSAKIREHTPNLMENDLLRHDRKEANYFDLLIVVCIRYIQGQALESLSPSFAKENEKVSSVACEFFDLMVTTMPEKSIDIAKYAYKPLLIVQRYAVSNNNFVIQVQLLSLLKFIIFGKNTLNSGDRKGELLGILDSPILMPKIIQGLNSRSPYVLIQYVNFINQALPTLCEILPQESLDKLISQILKTYRRLIDRYSNASTIQEDESMAVMIQDDKPGERINSNISAKQTGNLFESSGMQMQSNVMELISILIDGIYFLYNFFLNIDSEENTKASNDQPSDRKFIKILTLGVVGNGSKKGENEEPKYMDIAKSIVLSFKKTLKVFISCWTSQEDFDKYFQLYNMGMSVFNFDKFQEYNAADDVDDSTHIRNVKKSILRIVRSLYLKFREISMDTYLEVWYHECQYKEYPPPLTKLVRAGNFMQILSSLQIPMLEFIKHLSTSRRVGRIVSFYNEAPRKIKNNTIALNQDIADLEAIILYFLYAFISYKNLAYIEDSNKRRTFLTDIWIALLEFLDVFKQPQHPNTTIWILEIYNAFSAKYLPKDILDTRAVRSPMHINLNNMLLHLSSVLSKEYRLVFRPDKNIRSYTVLPFPPSIFEYYQQYPEDRDLFDLTLTSESILSQRYKLYGLIFLDKISVNLMKNCYAANKMDRMTMRIRLFMDKIFTLLAVRNEETMVMVGFVTSLIHSQFKELGKIVVAEFERNILELFDNDDFFICTKKTLGGWMEIIRYTVSQSREDILAKYLNRVVFSSYWSSEEHKNKTRIKSFSRVCFIIFSGEPETFMTKDKIKSLIDKIQEVIKDTNAHPSLISLILFSIRVLILRLSQATLTDVFRSIWPMLITLMMQIFNKNKEGKMSLKAILEALKLVELISLKNIEEFNLYQWMFIFDYFSLKYEPNEEKKNFPSTSPFVYTPVICKLLPADTHTQYKQVKIDPKEPIMFDPNNCKRQIIIRETTIASEEELYKIVERFFRAINQYSQAEYYMSLEAIEDWIRQDFISLDESLMGGELKNAA